VDFNNNNSYIDVFLDFVYNMIQNVHDFSSIHLLRA